MNWLSINGKPPKINRQTSRFVLGVLLSILCLIFVSACENTFVQEYTLEDAIEDGIISTHATDTSSITTGTNFNYTTPTLQQITYTDRVQALQIFPVEQELYFKQRSGDLTVLVEENQFVSKGDVLAHLTFETDKRHQFNYESAVAYLERLEREVSGERAKKRTEINKVRAALESAYNFEREQLTLDLRLLEIDLERYILNSDNTLRDNREEVAELKRLSGFEELTAPFDGVVINIFDGDQIIQVSNVYFQPPVMKILNPEAIFFEVLIPPTQEHPYSVIAHGDIVNVVGYIPVSAADRYNREPEFEFKARVVTDTYVIGPKRDVVYWLAPVDLAGLLNTLKELSEDDPMQTIRDITVFMPVELISPLGLTVPVETIRSDVTDIIKIYVLVYSNGSTEKRYIVTGQVAEGFVFVVYGLEEDEKVVLAR